MRFVCDDLVGRVKARGLARERNEKENEKEEGEEETTILANERETRLRANEMTTKIDETRRSSLSTLLIK